LEVRKNRLGFIIDGSYLSIGRDGNLDVTLPAEFVQRYGINTAEKVAGRHLALQPAELNETIQSGLKIYY
jgi:hypothetical protein